MALHQCKKCQKQFEVTTRGRPPTMCVVCKGSVIKPEIVAKQKPITVEPIVTESSESKDEVKEESVENTEYKVFATNMGYGYVGSSEKEASLYYEKCVKQSTAGYGKLGREKITMFHHSEKVKEFDPKIELV